MGSTLGDKYDFMLALRSQILEYLRETFDRHALESRITARSEKKGEKDCYGNAWLLPVFLKARGWLGHSFAASARSRASTNKRVMFMAVNIIPNMWHSSS